MANFLANENVPAEVVDAVRRVGHDMTWMSEVSQGAADDDLLVISLAESRILVTFARISARWSSVEDRRPRAA